MERSVDIATGESVAFSYELAGLGSRFFAVAIDMTIQLVVAFTALALVVWFGASQATHAPPKVDASIKFGVAVLAALGYFFAFVLFFGYFIIFEWRFAGRTPGKRLVGIRVVRDGGFALDFTSAVIRNVIRMIEFGLAFYAVSAVATLLSPLNRRLGDMAAGTLVIRETRFERTVTLASLLADPGTGDAELVRGLSAGERELVRRYVERRLALGMVARVALAAEIAGIVRPKLGASFAHLADDDLLVHVAGARPA